MRMNCKCLRSYLTKIQLFFLKIKIAKSKEEWKCSQGKKQNLDISGNMDGWVLDVIGSTPHILMILLNPEQMQGI